MVCILCSKVEHCAWKAGLPCQTHSRTQCRRQLIEEDGSADDDGAGTAGDSITNGYANLGNRSCQLLLPNVPSPDYEDATQAWGILAAIGLVADYQLIAWSGSGVSTYSTADNSHVNATATPWQIKYPTFPEFWPQVLALA